MGIVNLNDGTILAPGLRFDQDPDTGIIRSGANAIGIVVGGTKQYDFGSTANFAGQQLNNVIIGTVTPLAGFFNNLWLGDTSNAKMTTGLTINQGAADDEIIALKSSDVAHGMTARTETDTYATFAKVHGVGGLEITGLKATGAGGGSQDLKLVGLSVDAVDTTHTATGLGVVAVMAGLISGTSFGDVGANGNIFSVANNQTTNFIVDAEGDLFANGGIGSTNMVTLYDKEDDLSLVRAFDLARGKVCDDKGIIRTKWDRFVHHNEDDLVALGILGAPLSEGGLTNITRLQQLHNGAIWQLGQQYMEMAQRLEIAERKLAALPTGGV